MWFSSLKGYQLRRLGLTQRVDIIPSYHERRDCLDQRWAILLESMGYLPIILPNKIVDVSAYLDDLEIDGLILTGGNTLEQYGDKDCVAQERDQLEYEVIKFCIYNKLPMLGICRGAQILNLHYGGKLERISGHVNKHHNISIVNSVFRDWPMNRAVNSYHEYGIKANNLATDLKPIATNSDGSIEAFIHKTRPQVGIMWHPERDDQISQYDIGIFEYLFKL